MKGIWDMYVIFKIGTDFIIGYCMFLKIYNKFLIDLCIFKIARFW